MQPGATPLLLGQALSLDSKTTADKRVWLMGHLTKCVQATELFVTDKFRLEHPLIQRNEPRRERVPVIIDWLAQVLREGTDFLFG
jgi:hypothetical protein